MKKNLLNYNYIYLLLIFFIFFYIKILTFDDKFLGIDQSFYNQWILDLRAAENFFPQGDNNFLENLVLDKNSFLHQFFKRIYNNFSTIFALLSIFLNYTFSFLIDANPRYFNILSILFNTLIPFLILVLFKKKISFFKIKENIYYLLFILLFSLNFSFFFYAPLGVHNIAIFFNTVTIYFSIKNFKNPQFIDKYFLFFGIILPVLCHSYNFFFIFFYLFILIFYRFYFLKLIKIKKDLILLTSIFCANLLILLIVFSINKNNINFLESILSFFNNNSSFNIFVFLSNIILNSKLWLIKIFDYFGILNLLIFIFIIFQLKKPELLIAICAHYILFILLDLNKYYFSVILYNLIPIYIYFFFYIKNINFFFKKNLYLNILVVILIFFSILNSINEIFFSKNLSQSKKTFYNFYYKDNKIIKEKFAEIIKITKNKQIIFNSELSKNLYNNYSSGSINDYINRNYFELNEYKNLSSLDKIKSKNKLKYIYYKNKADNFTIKNTYYLYFGYNETNPKNKICKLMLKNKIDCEKIKNINYDNKYEEFLFHNNKYKLILYFID